MRGVEKLARGHIELLRWCPHTLPTRLLLLLPICTTATAVQCVPALAHVAASQVLVALITATRWAVRDDPLEKLDELVRRDRVSNVDCPGARCNVERRSCVPRHISRGAGRQASGGRAWPMAVAAAGQHGCSRLEVAFSSWLVHRTSYIVHAAIRQHAAR
eukprot:COSAG01_NODE_64_length_29509_cov_1035.985209_38_plen_160_part_00